MEENGKNVSPYKGVFLTAFFLIVAPLFFSFTLDIFIGNDTQIEILTIIVFGFGMGILFDLGCIIAGLMTGTFSIVKARVADFFDDLVVSFKFAVQSYFNNIKENGIVFWIYLSIMAATVVIFILKLKELIAFM